MRPTWRRAERLAPLLLLFGCWGFQSPSLRQGAVGTGYSSPAAYLFGIALVQDKSPPIRSAFPFRISPWPVTFGGPLEGAWIQAGPQANGA
jgi:hypothetical protein